MNFGKTYFRYSTKPVFTFNNIIYEQKDDVSMRLSLGPALANVIMTELKNVFIKPFITNGLVKLFCRLKMLIRFKVY